MLACGSGCIGENGRCPNGICCILLGCGEKGRDDGGGAVAYDCGPIIGCGGDGHMGRGHGNWGPRVPRNPDGPNMGDSGVVAGDCGTPTGLFGALPYVVKYCGRGPDMMGGGDGPHGDGGW